MKSRRVERKRARKEKKAKRNQFFINKNKSKLAPNEENVDIFDEKSDDYIEEKSDTNIDLNKNVNKIKPKVNKRLKLSVKQKRDIEREDKEIKRLEKKLKLNRRKKNGKRVTTLPKSFQSEGLDYILDVIDFKRDETTSDQDFYQSKQFDDSDNEFSEGIDEEMDSNQEDSDIEDDDNGSESDHNSSHGLDSSDEKVVKPKETNELKEDIYGFIRDSFGNIVKPTDETKKESLVKTSVSGLSAPLMRSIRGALNRLTANNMLTISGQMKELYQQNSRHDVNESLFTTINSFLIDLNYSSLPKMSTEVALLVAILHSLVGEEVGGYAIHWLITKFDEFIKQLSLDDSKRMDNLVIVLLNLYVCGLIDSLLVYEILMKLCDDFSEKSIELINLILKSVGFVLRKDNAIKMKELILRVQNVAKNVDKNNLSGNRITFLLDSLIAIKNNNTNKLKGYGTVVDLELIETTLKSTLKKSRVPSISGNYQTILRSSHWYSYTQNIDIDLDNQKTNAIDLNQRVDQPMNDQLVKALRLNTPLRKTIVMALSTCNDFIDASHRLISIGKKQFSEVTNVLLHVCIHEKQFNPFYCHLFHRLGQCDRKYKIALDFSIRDKVSELEALTPNERIILSKLIFELLKLNALAITCLKVVHFTDMNKIYVKFIKNILTPVLKDEQLIEPILSKIPNKDSFATAIRLFINCFIDTKDRNQLNPKYLKIKQK